MVSFEVNDYQSRMTQVPALLRMCAVFFVGLAMLETRIKTSRYDKLYKRTSRDNLIDYPIIIV